MRSIRKKPPFSLLEGAAADDWFSQAKLIQLKTGQPLLIRTQLQNRIFLVVRGKVRLLAKTDTGESITLELRGPGQLLGWVSLLRAEPCEGVMASEDTLVLALPAEGFLSGLASAPEFAQWFNNTANSHESFVVAQAVLGLQAKRSDDALGQLKQQWPRALVTSLQPGQPFEPPASPFAQNHLAPEHRRGPGGAGGSAIGPRGCVAGSAWLFLALPLHWLAGSAGG